MSYISSDQSVAALGVDDIAKNEVFKITFSQAENSALGVYTITVPATGSAAQGDFFVLTDFAGLDEAFWVDIDANGTSPAAAIFAATDTQVEVDIVGAANAATNAALVKTAIDAGALDLATVVDNSDGTLTVTQGGIGTATAPVVKNSSEAGSGSFLGTEGTAGVASSIQNDHVSFGAFYVWSNVNSEGSDPTPGGTGILSAHSIGDSVATQVTTIVTAIDGTSGFSAQANGTTEVFVRVDADGTFTDVDASNWTGATVTIEVQGQADPGFYPEPSTSVNSLSV